MDDLITNDHIFCSASMCELGREATCPFCLRTPSFPHDASLALRTFFRRPERRDPIYRAYAALEHLCFAGASETSLRTTHGFRGGGERPRLAIQSCRQPRRFAFCAWHLLEHKGVDVSLYLHHLHVGRYPSASGPLVLHVRDRMPAAPRVPYPRRSNYMPLPPAAYGSVRCFS